jgi:hypothetical protein
VLQIAASHVLLEEDSCVIHHNYHDYEFPVIAMAVKQGHVEFHRSKSKFTMAIGAQRKKENFRPMAWLPAGACQDRRPVARSAADSTQASDGA